MNICFYCDTPFSFGGVQRVLAVIAKALSAHNQVTILSRDDNSSSADTTMYGLNEVNITYRYIQIPPIACSEYLPCKTYSFLYKKILPQTKTLSRWYSYSSFPKSQRTVLIKELNNRHYDVIIGVHAFLSLQLASIREKLTAPKVIGWMHTSYDAFFNTPGFYLYEQKKQFFHEMPRLDQIVVLSHYDQTCYEKYMGLHTIPIYNPLTLNSNSKGDPSYKKFLSVGRMSYKTKGFDILIEAFAIFAKDNEEWTLNIVGEGPEETMLKALIAKYHLNDRITICPFTKNIEKHYSTASAYILSSRWEGFPLVLAEAMSHRLPIIASDLPIVNELIKDKGNALIFSNTNINELADKMKIIASLPTEEILKMGCISNQISESLKLSAITKQWEKLLAN